MGADVSLKYGSEEVNKNTYAKLTQTLIAPQAFFNLGHLVGWLVRISFCTFSIAFGILLKLRLKPPIFLNAAGRELPK